MRRLTVAVCLALAGAAVAAPPKASFSDVQTSALSVQGTAQAGALWGAGQNVGALAHSRNGDTGTTATNFTVGSLAPAADVSYQFGQAGVNVFLRWVNATSRFEFWNGTGSTLAPLACGLLTASGWNYYASGSDVAQHKFAAPSSGTNRYTAWFDAPSGGTVNASVYSEGDVVGATRYYFPSSTGTAGQGIFGRNASNQILGGVGSLDSGGKSYVFLTANKFFNGTAIVDSGISRLGSFFQIVDNTFGFYSVSTAAASTLRMGVGSGGHTAIGAATLPTSGARLQVTGDATSPVTVAIGTTTPPTTGNTLAVTGSISATAPIETTGNINTSATLNAATVAATNVNATTVTASSGITSGGYPATRWRGGNLGSAPTTDLRSGDIYHNSGTDALYMYCAETGSWYAISAI